MIGDGINLNDIIKVRQIRSKNVKRERSEPNKNYSEFREVYKGVFGHGFQGESKSSFASSNYSSGRRMSTPTTAVKTVKLEWPELGAEGAILAPKSSKKKTTLKLSGKPKPKTQQILEKWDQMEKQAARSQSEAATSPKMLIEKANADIDLASAQLQKIKSIMKSKSMSKNPDLTSMSSLSSKFDKSTEGIRSPDRIKRRPKSPTYKAKKRYDRHYDCINNKYMATLTTMKQKLQKLEDKYFKKPQVVYKNVRDIFTQQSNIEVLYNSNQPSEDLKIEEVFRGIKMDLDAIANTKVDGVYSPRSSQSPRDLSYRKSFNMDELDKANKLSYSRIIDHSESKLNKLRAIKHNIVDVESFCDKLCKIAEDEDDTGKLSPVKPQPETKHVAVEDTRHNMFDESEIQKSVSKSAYLMKEFNIQPGLPTVKFFSDSSSFIRNKSSFFDTSEGMKKSKKKGDQSITSLIDNLNMALNNSLYKPVHS